MLRRELVIALDKGLAEGWLPNSMIDPTELATARDLARRASAVLIVPAVLEQLIESGCSAAAIAPQRPLQVVNALREFRVRVNDRAERYVAVHADPRHCRAVAEAECAGATHFLTLNDELVTRFDARTDAILVLRPSAAAAGMIAQEPVSLEGNHDYHQERPGRDRLQ